MLGLSQQASERLESLSRHGVSYYATIVAAFVLGMAVANGFTTQEALHGSEEYFVHKYCPKIAAKAAIAAARQQEKQDEWWFTQ